MFHSFAWTTTVYQHCILVHNRHNENFHPKDALKLIHDEAVTIVAEYQQCTIIILC